jgi:hypothetical protein
MLAPFSFENVWLCDIAVEQLAARHVPGIGVGSDEKLELLTLTTRAMPESG